MRNIKYIAVHCTATAQSATVSSIRFYWRNIKGWKMPGYHFLIEPGGEVIHLLDLNKISNGVKGYNSESVHVCYIGGIDAQGKPKDTRTREQKESLLVILKGLKKQFPKAIIQGHRDFRGVKKACPSFDAKKEYQSL